MLRSVALCGLATLLTVMSAAYLHAGSPARPIVVTMTNDPANNEIRVYDAITQALLQTLPTRGRGGVGGNARGVSQHDSALVAVVNFGSNNVSLFRREGDGLMFAGTVTTTSAPVSVDFGNGHMYVAGATTVDSFLLYGQGAAVLDGTTTLELAEGGVPPVGSTAQVGVISRTQLLVTLKNPDPGSVDVVELRDGAVAGLPPAAVAAPAGAPTPFGFSVYPDGSALITLAGLDQDGVFRDGAFRSVTPAGQGAPCWATTTGKYVFVANTAGRTISRLVGTGSHVFVDAETAAVIDTGGPADIDAGDGLLGVIDRGAGASHLSLFTYNAFGELAAQGGAIDIGVPNANGIAILSSAASERD